MLSFYFTGSVIDEFTKNEDKLCTQSYDAYGTLDEAIGGCKLDVDCTGVYDDGCNGARFKLCHRTNSVIKPSTHGSCIYNKKGRNCLCSYFSYKYLQYYTNIFRILHYIAVPVCI